MFTFLLTTYAYSKQLYSYHRNQEHGDTVFRTQTQFFQDVVVQQIANHKTQRQYKRLITSLKQYSNNSNFKKNLISCKKSGHSQYFKFGGQQVGYIGNETNISQKFLKRFDDDCFKSVLLSYQRLSQNSVRITLRAGQKKKKFCNQGYIIGTGSNYNFRGLDLKKSTRITWKHMTQIQIQNVQLFGIRVFRLCDKMLHFFPDIIKTAQLFVGGLGDNPKIPFFGSKTPMYQQRLNVDFIQESTGFRWKQRKDVFQNLSDDQVKAGDFLAITRFDGIDQIIQYGAGSHSGHSAIILQVDGQKVVCQSQDGWYWPKHGIQRNKWSQWKKWAQNAGFNVAVLPLKQQFRTKFNKTAAEMQFKRLQGFPYGYHNFLFGWIDTSNQSLPNLLDPDLIVVLFSFLQRIYQKPFRMILTQALNKRLNTTGLHLDQIAIQIARRNTTMADLMSIVQKDGWWYSDGWSYVCSSFAAAIYKSAGLLNDVEATQFTPRDIYILDIFDENSVPQKCKKIDPSLPYCQIMGKWLMQLPQYSTIKPYQHMNQHCPTQAPDYNRTPNC